MSNEKCSFNMRFSDKSLLEKLDKEAEINEISRTQLIQNIVSIYLSAKDDFVTACLPMIVHSMIKNEINNLLSTTKDIIKDIYISTIKIRRVTEKLDTFLAPEFEKIEFDQMKIDELLHLIEQSEKEENE
ncbi:MAG: hypothetical protein J5956_09885 [Ruminococcus sp.]|nr:hypothetical protein [Ruminococcus sp.]